MTASCGPYKATAGGCTPHTEVFWARKESDASPVLLYLQVTCVAGKAVKTLTTDKAGTIPAVGYTEVDKIGTVIKGERGASCEDPLHVVICDPAPTANLKIEFSETVLYSASTEQTIVRIRQYNEDTGLWTLRYENLDGTPFVGTLPADLYELTAQVNVTRSETLGCSAGVAFIQRSTAKFDAETGALESTTTEWVDASGTIFTMAPVGFVLGTCPDAPPRPNLIWLERSGGLVTMADIINATGAVGVGSVTVKQTQGRGAVTGDSGSGVPLDAGETWSWGVISQNQTESLSASALSMDATGGEQRITAVYWV